MNLTNTEGIEESILLAIKRGQSEYGSEVSEYLQTVGEFDVALSVTSLAMPPQMYQLKRRHGATIVKDCRDCYATLLGNLFHKLAEDHPADGDVVEKRVGRTYIASLDGAKIRVHIHGKADKYNLLPGRNYLKDYKFCKMAAMQYEKTAYEQQVNLLRFLQPPEVKEHISNLANVFAFSDWRAIEAKEGRSREPNFSREVYYDMWDDAKCYEVLSDRMSVHLRSVFTLDEDLPECTKEELWWSRSGFRVWHRTKGTGEWGKIASGWAPTMEEAMVITKKKATEFRIDPTEGRPRRCSGCDVEKICSQKKRLDSQMNPSEDKEWQEDQSNSLDSSSID